MYLYIHKLICTSHTICIARYAKRGSLRKQTPRNTTRAKSILEQQMVGLVQGLYLHMHHVSKLIIALIIQ